MWFNINFDKFSMDFTPTILRVATIYKFSKILIAPIVSLHYQWGQLRLENINKLSYNSQKCYLRKALNDKFDPFLRRITIDDTLDLGQDYIYTPGENLDVYLGVINLELNFNYAGAIVDFLINVPASIMATKINELNAVINFYKLAGKNYQILPI